MNKYKILLDEYFDVGSDMDDDDLYLQYKRLQREDVVRNDDQREE